MDVLFEKSKSKHMNSTSSQFALGDGDCVRCCRLCGGENNLKHFQDTYVWEGNEQRYDELLYDCFGIVVVPSDSMICDYCVRGLKSMERFKALVFAAFHKDSSVSDVTSLVSCKKAVTTSSCQTTTGKRKLKTPISNQIQSEKKQITEKKQIIEIPERKQITEITERKQITEISSKKKVNKKIIRPEVKYKRTTVQCQKCKQRYPSYHVKNEPFTCARCKRNGDIRNHTCKNCNIAMPSNFYRVHLDLTKGDRMGMARQMKTHSTPNRSTFKPRRRQNDKPCFKKKTLSNVTTAVNAHGISKTDLFFIVPDDEINTQKKSESNMYVNILELLSKMTHSLTKIDKTKEPAL